LKLSPRMNVEQAFRCIVRSCLDQVEANESGVTQFHDVESLHQMRIGLRRLRAALAMFQDIIRLPAGLEHELEWAVEQLGPARDWDVLLESTLPRIARETEGPSRLAGVAHAAQERVHALHALAGGAVKSERYRKLMQALEAWLDKRGWRETLDSSRKARLKMRVMDFSGAILEQDQQRLLRRGRKLKSATPQDRHRVRIAAKRSRYAAEFFASLYPGKRVRPYVGALTTLQDELGWMNDAAVADRLLGELAEQNDALQADAGYVRGYLASCAHGGVDRVRRLWKKFKPINPPH
jgi:triphosphatase